MIELDIIHKYICIRTLMTIVHITFHIYIVTCNLNIDFVRVLLDFTK